MPSTPDWSTLSPLLDRMFELDPIDRPAWLAALTLTQPDTARVLKELLEEHRQLNQSEFLTGSAVAASTDLTGLRVGAYTLERILGRGGMGEVWLAARSDGRYEGKCAVKFLDDAVASRKLVERFRREGNVLARLSHPNIARLLDAGTTAEGRAYLAIEYVDGERLDRHCARLGVIERVRLFVDVVAAVAHAHSQLIIHRDIKPSNVLVARDGQVKLLDFGIAKLLDSNSSDDHTRFEDSALTPEFAAPEQLLGELPSTATDVYQLGMLLYVLLTDKHPVQNTGTRAEKIRAALDGTIPRASEMVDTKWRKALRGDLDAILEMALRKNPADRYSTAHQLKDELLRYLNGEPVLARRGAALYRLRKFVTRHRIEAAAGALVTVAVVAGVIGTWTQARRATEQAARADVAARGATEQRDFALQQLARAEAINDLNSLVLSDGLKEGERITIDELMARAERIVERQKGESLETQVELLLSVGYQYQTRDEHAKGRALIAKAYEQSRASTDAATRAKASCALASTTSQAGDSKRAEQLLQQAEGELPASPQFALYKVFCLEMGMYVAAERGDGKTAVERAQAALDTLHASKFESAIAEQRVSVALAAAYGFAGRWRETASLYETIYGKFIALGRGGTQMDSGILNNWANALLALGRPLEAERMLRRSIEIDSTSEERSSPIRLMNLARALRDLDRLDEAQRLAELAYSRAKETGHEIAIDQSLSARASIYRLQGKLSQGDSAVGELEGRISRLPPGHIMRAALALERAAIAQARGELSKAVGFAEEAIAIAKASSRGATQLSRAYLRRSEIALAAREFDSAVGYANASLELETKGQMAGDVSNLIGLGHLALGRSLLGLGRDQLARASFKAALEHLRPSLGEHHPATIAASALTTN